MKTWPNLHNGISNSRYLIFVLFRVGFLLTSKMKRVTVETTFFSFDRSKWNSLNECRMCTMDHVTGGDSFCTKSNYFREMAVLCSTGEPNGIGDRYTSDSNVNIARVNTWICKRDEIYWHFIPLGGHVFGHMALPIGTVMCALCGTLCAISIGSWYHIYISCIRDYALLFVSSSSAATGRAALEKDI